jgi:hypothetical protein
VASNGYDTSIGKHFNKPGQRGDKSNKKEFWAKFTYFGKETRAVTKLFKETQIRIDCHKKHVGQTRDSFRTRYKEHFHDFKYNIRKSSFATHLFDNNHSVGPIYDIMDVLYTTGKGRFMDRVERFYIYRETRDNNQINDKNTVKQNAIFDAINSQDSAGAHTN